MVKNQDIFSFPILQNNINPCIKRYILPTFFQDILFILLRKRNWCNVDFLLVINDMDITMSNMIDINPNII